MSLPWTFPPGQQLLLPDLEPEVLQTYTQQFGRKLEGCHQEAVLAMQKVQARNKADFDKRHSVGLVHRFSVGDWVFVRSPLGRKNKLLPDFHGPYQIVRFKDPTSQTAMFVIPQRASSASDSVFVSCRTVTG